MISSQLDIIPQVTGAITHAKFWASNVFVDHYSDYFHDHLTRGISAEETLQSKEYYERLASTHGTRVFSNREDNGIFQIPF